MKYFLGANVCFSKLSLWKNYQFLCLTLINYVLGSNELKATDLNSNKYRDAHILDMGWREVDSEEWFADN